MNILENFFWHIATDTGGTFTDCIGIDPEGNLHRTKLLSSGRLRLRCIFISSDRLVLPDFSNPEILVGYTVSTQGSLKEAKITKMEDGQLFFDQELQVEADELDFFTGEEAPIVACRVVTKTNGLDDLPPIQLRVGSTKGTNALLEYKGVEPVLFVTKGFKDLLRIGDQQRPHLFQLNIPDRPLYYAKVIEIDERINAKGEIERTITAEELTELRSRLKQELPIVAVVSFLHGYLNPVHELKLGAFLKELGVQYVTTSGDVSPLVNYFPRTETSVINGYLQPILSDYLKGISNEIKKGGIQVMTSSGGLSGMESFYPKDSLFSGPAGGVVGAASVAKRNGIPKILALDMGGTSTDVSRYDGEFEYMFEASIEGAKIMSPSLNIKTVAAGGGSICSYENNKFVVGPDSAGAHPGPACYGAGGPLTITDVDLLAGRLSALNFKLPLKTSQARVRLKNLQEKVNGSIEEDVLQGLIKIANEKMAGAIREISVARGFDPKEHALMGFGGAGGLHVFEIAEELGVDQVIIPYDAGILSAVGIMESKQEWFKELQVLRDLASCEQDIQVLFRKVEAQAKSDLLEEISATNEEIEVTRRMIFLKLEGQSQSIELEYTKGMNLRMSFKQNFIKLFNYWPNDKAIIVDSVKIIVSLNSTNSSNKVLNNPVSNLKLPEQKSLVSGEWREVGVSWMDSFAVGEKIQGPILLLNESSTSFVTEGWTGYRSKYGDFVFSRQVKVESRKELSAEVELELFTNRFSSIAESMGYMLQRTASSVNIKDRLDFSCGLLDKKGELIVNAPHIPVHLGALGECVRSVITELDVNDGDVVITNHPGYGGSHLPDVTLITPFFVNNELVAYLANRSHHAEIGGIVPGSMPPNAKNLYEEGVVLRPQKIIEKGVSNFEEILSQLSKGKYPSRNPNENLADFSAGIASLKLGLDMLSELVSTYGVENVQKNMGKLNSLSQGLLQKSLKVFTQDEYRAEEYLDGGQVIKVCFVFTDRIVVDFTGTSKQLPCNLNATPAIVKSAVLYVLRLLVGREIPLNEGLLSDVDFIIPRGTMLNPLFDSDPSKCPPVVGGNVETSQRIVDTCLKALKLSACSQGTMNNFIFGDSSYGYYETIGGGVGATPKSNGRNAVHQHMTNTRITDPEIFELNFPVKLCEFSIRGDSGGLGERKGGDGIIREVEFLKSAKVSFLMDHRIRAPYGMNGGQDGAVGKQYLISKDKVKEIGGYESFTVNPGDRVRIETPGGGGYGEIN